MSSPVFTNVDNANIGTELKQTVVVIEMHDVDIHDNANIGAEKTQTVDVANQRRIASKTLFIGVFIIVLIVIAIAIWRTVVIFG
jgi:hypothetical protein